MKDNYKIPSRISRLMTKEFLHIFKSKLDEVFQLEPDATAWSCYYHLESTGGWYDAFNYACDNHPSPHLGVGIKRYYNTLDWYDGDIFDDELAELMVKKGVIKKGEIPDYGFDDMSYLEEWLDYIWEFDRRGSGCKIYKKKYII
ncbi:MAG: hypothetical protein ACRDD7_11840 [Peptostreptococcaceae bacterium]